MTALRRAAREPRGQTLVEFSLALIPFLFVLMGIVDLGRGVYTNNAVSQAAREIARTVAVHPCDGPCATDTYSSDALETIAAQKQLVPGLTDDGIVVDCQDITGATVSVADGSQCPPGDFVRVTVSATFRLVTPFLPVPNPFGVSAIAHVQVP